MNYPELLNLIMKRGQEVSSNHTFDNSTKELMHVEFEVGRDCIFDFPETRPFEKMKKYMDAELAWQFSGDRNAEFISQHAKLWDAIKNPDGTLNSNYGFLVFYNQVDHPSLQNEPYPNRLPDGGLRSMRTLPPFEWAATCLEKSKDSRQAMVTYNTGGFNFPGNKDYICSQHQAFYIRNDELLCYVALRSSDAIFGLPYNMIWWQVVYQQMLLRLRKTHPNLREVRIIVTIYSAHIYAKHFALVSKMLQSPVFKYDFSLRNSIPLGNDLDWCVKNLKTYYMINGGVQVCDRRGYIN